MQSVTILQAGVKDLQTIMGIIGMLSLDIPGFVWNTPEFLQKQVESGAYFLAQHEGKTAGIISLRQRNEKLYIETLAVAPEYRRQKIGSQLVAFAKEKAKEKGLNQICACSFFEYKIGDFYTNQGFRLLSRPGAYNDHNYHIFLLSI